MAIIAQATNTGPAIDYAWLLKYASDWSHRSDIAARLPMFVTLAEARIKALLNDRAQDVLATLTTTAEQPFVNLPDDLLHVRSVAIPGLAPAVEYMTPARLSACPATPGTPRHYTVIGKQLYLAPAPDAAHALSITYTASFAPLTESTPINALITKWPDVYLWGVMREVAKFCKDGDMAGVYEADFQAAINSANLLSWNTTGPMSVRTETRTA